METTSKPTFGLPALTPVDDNSGRYSSTNATLSPDITYVSDKTVLAEINLNDTYKSSKRYKRPYDGSYLRVYIRRIEKEQNSGLAEFASRGLEEYDDRMVEYRKSFSAIFKTLYANGLLCGEKVTAEWLENPKGVRWCQRAFCSCGCSPSFKLPKGIYLSRFNTADVVLQEKQGATIKVVTTQERLDTVNQILGQVSQAS